MEEDPIHTTAIINRCRPGNGASCAFCCGSHNYTLSPEHIESLFASRGRERRGNAARHPEEAGEEKLVPGGMQCPHVGIVLSEPGLVCCLAYEDCDRGGELQSFFTGTCKLFLCPAWDELTDKQVLFAAGLMADWFYYSLLINDLDTLCDLCAEFRDPGEVPPERLERLKADLTQRLHEEDVL